MAVVRTSVGVVLRDGDPAFAKVYAERAADGGAIQAHRGHPKVATVASWKAALAATSADDLPTAFLAKLTVGDLRRTWKRLSATVSTPPFVAGMTHLIAELGLDDYGDVFWKAMPARLLVASAVDRWLREKELAGCPGVPGVETLPADDVAWIARPTVLTDARAYPRHTGSSNMALHAVVAGMHRVATDDVDTPLCVDEHTNRMFDAATQLRMTAMPLMDVGSLSPGCTYVDPVVALFTVQDAILLRRTGSGKPDLVCAMLGATEPEVAQILGRTGIRELTSVHEVRNVADIPSGANPCHPTARRRVLWTSIPADNTLLRVRGEAPDRADSVLTLIQRAMSTWGANVSKRHDRQVEGKKFSTNVPHTQLAAGCSAASFVEDHTLHDLAVGPVAVYAEAMFGGLLNKTWEGKWVLGALPPSDAELKTKMDAALALANAWFDQQHVAPDLRHKGHGGDRRSAKAKRRRIEKPAALPADPADPEQLEVLLATPSRRENLRQWRRAAAWLTADDDREIVPMAYPPFYVHADVGPAAAAAAAAPVPAAAPAAAAV